MPISAKPVVCKSGKNIAILCEADAGHVRNFAHRQYVSMGGAEQVTWLDRVEQLDAVMPAWLHVGMVRQESALLERLKHIPLLTMMAHHDFPHVCPPQRRQKLMHLYTAAKLILTPRQAISDSLQQAGVATAKTHVLAAYPCQINMLHKPEVSKPLRLLYFGYSDSSFGLDRIPALMAACEQNQLAVQLMVAGEMDKATTADFAALPNVEIIAEFIADEVVAELLAAADCLLLPYRKSVATPKIMMAAEAGVPCLRTPAVKDWLGRDDAPGKTLAWSAQAWAKALADMGLQSAEQRQLCLAWAEQMMTTYQGQWQEIKQQNIQKLGWE